MARHKHAPLEPGTSLDRFRLERLLGTGAFGQVWLAMDEGSHGFRKKVALKILAESDNQTRIEALIREARICGALNHPNVIDVYGVMQVERSTFIIMEFVEGETLSSLWKDLDFLGVRFPRSIILDIGIAVAEALYHGWTAKDADGKALRIVHRDLKPANVMISDRGVVKVGDFGIAKVAPDMSVTRTGKLKGTPSYLAPELWQGSRDFRPSIDLWSLGVILWELVAAKRFYGRASMAEIVELVVSRDPAVEVREMLAWFPELAPVVEEMLQRDPDARSQSALAVASQLRAIRSGIGASGDLLQFSRLVRAGRLEPEERNGSLVAMPALPEGLLDWQPLVSVAAEEPSSGSPWETDPRTAPVKIGPTGDGEQAAGDGAATGEGAGTTEGETAFRAVTSSRALEAVEPEPGAEPVESVAASSAVGEPAVVLGSHDPKAKTVRMGEGGPEPAGQPPAASQKRRKRRGDPEQRGPAAVEGRRRGPPIWAIAIGLGALAVAALLILKAVA